MCACMCVWDRERERERIKEKKGDESSYPKYYSPAAAAVAVLSDDVHDVDDALPPP